MKRFTFMLLAAFIAVVAFAQKGNLKSMEAHPFTPAKNMAAPVAMNLKQAPKGLALKTVAKTKARRAAKKAVAVADLVGDYQWDYLQSSETSTDLESLTTTAGSSHVVISESATTEGGIAISGMSTNDLEATVVNAEGSDYFQIEGGQIAGTSSYGDYALYGMFYYEGDDENAAGWYYDDIYGYVEEDGSITIGNWIVRVLSGGTYNGYSLTPYWVEGSTLTPAEPLAVVETPADLVTEEYAVSARNYKDDADVSGVVYVGFDGNDVYVKGLCTYLPEAWAKGTLEGTTITFPYGQYFGNYAETYDIFLNVLMGEDVVFDYDAEAGTLTAQNTFFLVDNSSLYFDSYRGAVLKKVIEQAATPANPAITGLSNGNYGWYITFNVPNVDVDGNGLASSKLSYTIYTDIEGEITPLTFTPETHSRLTEAMTEIPYGFTENYDFYDGTIYLNDLYSADWNKIGIQSIYRGGGEENATEIQWYHIKDYAAVTTEATFDFNAMSDEPCSTSTDHSGDIPAEGRQFVEGVVTLTVSAATGNTANRFWNTDNGPQLRVYSGTMTFSVPEGMNITGINFNHNGKWGTNTVNVGEIDNNTTTNVATWTGAAQEVVLTIAANTQLNSIVVTVAAEGGEPGPVEPEEAIDPDGLTYTFDDGGLEGWTTIDADGDGHTWMNTSNSNSLSAHNGSAYAVFSESYSSNGGPLTPDNYLVSPKVKLGSMFSFFAVAQDAAYPTEHFGVFVSTTDKAVESFVKVDEWTLTAARGNKAMLKAPGVFRSPNKAQGKWYQYIVDLSAYEGQEGYVAIRHFDSTDQFYILVDDISFGVSDYVITPEEGTVESLNDFTLTFNNYDVAIVDGEVAQAELYKDENFDEPFATAALSLADNVLSFSFGEVTEAGEYTLLIPDGTLRNASEDKVLGDLEFRYTIEAKPELVVLPEGVEAQEYTLVASGATSQSSINIRDTKLVAFDGNDVYVQGLAYYFPDAFIKGTLTADGQVAFPSGQFVGEDEYGKEYLVGVSVAEDYSFVYEPAILFNFDEESGVLSMAEGIYYGESASSTEASLYNYFESAVYTPGVQETPDLVVLPEGVEPEVWTIDGTFGDNYSSDNIVRQTEVAFDGNDIYVKGIAFYFEEAWMKGTIDAATGIATFPTGQFVGEDEYGLEFVVGSDDGETLCDIEFAYDADAKTLTQQTSYIIDNANTPDEIASYGNWTNMLIYEGEAIIEEPIEAPEDLVTETYLFKATELPLSDDPERARVLKAEGEEEAVTFDFNSLGTEEEPWPVSSGDSQDGDITEALTLTEDNVTLTISPKEEGINTQNRFWGTNNGPQLRVYSGTLTFDVPEGYEMTQIVFNHNGNWKANKVGEEVIPNDTEAKVATWTGNAQEVIVTIAGNSQINSIAVTVAGGEEPEIVEYTHQMQVGFDGNDVYFKGVSDNTADMWLKGTLSEDGKTVTIPANQYMGEVTALWFTFPYYFTAVAEDGVTMEDIVLNYDAENSTFTTNQLLVLHDGKRVLGEPYQVFTDVEITKMPEFAATPADPSIDSYKFEGTSYPYINFVIPAQDVDGNDILTSKLFYTVWTEVDGVEEPFVVRADEYRDVTEDMTEIPYNWDDGYDIYKGGSRFYINPASVLAYWTKIGIQSIYYGGGERNVSEIAWMENPVKDPTATGITTVKADDLKGAAIYNLAGQRLQTVQKGLNIINGRKVVIK